MGEVGKQLIIGGGGGVGRAGVEVVGEVEGGQEEGAEVEEEVVVVEEQLNFCVCLLPIFCQLAIGIRITLHIQGDNCFHFLLMYLI